MRHGAGLSQGRPDRRAHHGAAGRRWWGVYYSNIATADSVNLSGSDSPALAKNHLGIRLICFQVKAFKRLNFDYSIFWLFDFDEIGRTRMSLGIVTVIAGTLAKKLPPPTLGGSDPLPDLPPSVAR
jgi:hypothetical protein